MIHGRFFGNFMDAVADRDTFVHQNKLEVLYINDKAGYVDMRNGDRTYWVVYRSEMDEQKVRALDLDTAETFGLKEEFVRYIKSRVKT